MYDCLILILCTEFNLKACPHRQAGTEMTSWEDKLLIKQVISSLFLCPWCHLYSCPLIRPTHLVRSLGSVHTFKQCLMDIDQVSGQTYVLLYILGHCCLARIIGYTQQQTKYQANDLICWFRLIKGPGPLGLPVNFAQTTNWVTIGHCLITWTYCDIYLYSCTMVNHSLTFS